MKYRSKFRRLAWNGERGFSTREHEKVIKQGKKVSIAADKPIFQGKFDTTVMISEREKENRNLKKDQEILYYNMSNLRAWFIALLAYTLNLKEKEIDYHG